MSTPAPAPTPNSFKNRVFSNSSLKNMLNSVSNSGTSTPNVMEKTDSVVNLTKPSLYGIYNDNSVLNLNKEGEDVDEYIENSKLYINQQTSEGESSVASGQKSSRKTEVPLLVRWIKTFVKVVILAGAAYLYNETTKHIHNNHIQVSKLTYEPLFITNMFLTNFVHKLKPFSSYGKTNTYSISWIDNFLALSIQGLVMGLIHPMMDCVLPTSMTKRLLSSDPNASGSKDAHLFNDLVRALVTFLGISYAVRKIEWSSSLQVLMIWSLLNPGLWLLLDGTISGFLSSLLIATLACLSVYLQNYDLVLQYANQFLQLGKDDDFIAIWLYVGSFFFCGLIIFGKLGRGLFGH